ncbi:hypothetical protein CLV63_10887 [Murinocardiopsis flavida]|uniref:Uncharacterized protein n=1 Tax=Murinocardiopsis flavida TaxID=645275 RepID=A0A2P8DJL1_9ACTN|nr:hypothetical protein [Murinocardiopsis flavida]PSK97369.1 hypothetical protein CLV63_10887 [Murinocardiopsis flavida]
MTADQDPQSAGGAEEHTPGSADSLEAPEADTAEQRIDVDEDTEEWDSGVLDRFDVPEADAVEQRRGVGGDADEYR